VFVTNAIVRLTDHMARPYAASLPPGGSSA
jgi:hypothetical protein